MTNEPSPRPWRIADGMQETIVDDRNNIVANVSNNATAALVVEAVNERDRLRDLVKRMIPFVEKCHSDALDLSKTIKGICALKGVDTSEIDRINSEHDALIAEARAAIGEDAR